ncbi:MAG TPA: SURF1 family protein [Ilumatobacteraceae bacterium]|jgi:cytochrome oxidase assembly protein ShyY1
MPTDRAESPRPDGSGQSGRSPYRFLVTPKWIAFHLLAIALVVTMINLALWQLRRLDERRDFNARVRANANQLVTDLADIDLSTADPAAVEWRRVRLSGVYADEYQFLVVNRSQNGETGRNVVNPLVLPDRSLILVNRGFVPIEDAVPAVPSGPVTIIGRLRTTEVRKTGQPSDADTPGLTEIHRIDIPLLNGQFDTTLRPMYVEQLEAEPADATTLQPIVPPSLDEGPHLSYTIQWFIFSACVVVGWVLAVRRSLATRSGKAVRKRKSAYVPIADDESAR